MNNDFKNTTCFNAHKNAKVSCKIEDCRYWHNLNGCNNNCIINKVNDSFEEPTLQEIGNLFDITRMRVCQIEKQTLEKLQKKILLF